MPIRHGGRLASRASTWPRDHFCRNTKAPRRSWPTRWNEFLPISMPMTAISLLSFWDMACSFALGAPRQFGPLAGLEHGTTIPLADMDCAAQHRANEHFPSAQPTLGSQRLGRPIMIGLFDHLVRALQN